MIHVLTNEFTSFKTNIYGEIKASKNEYVYNKL